MSLAELPAALDNTLMVSRSGLQCAALMSYRYKLQCLKIQVRQIARERDKARLDLEKAERRCLHLSRELDEQYVTLEHTQSKLRDFQAETEAKDLLLQQAVSHQAKLEADTQLFQGKEASWQGKLKHTMKENIQLQNKVTEMAEKLAASEKLVLELQKELNCVVKDKLGQVESHSPELLNQSECFAEIVLEYERQCQVLWDQNGLLQRELERLYLQLQESRAERGLPAGGLSSQDSSPVCPHPSPLHPTSACTETSLSMEQLQEQMRDLKVQLEMKGRAVPAAGGEQHAEKSTWETSARAEAGKGEGQRTQWSEKSSREISHLNVRMCRLGSEVTKHQAGHGAGPDTIPLWSQRLAEAEWLRGAETAARLEHHQQHAACWMEMELLQQQLRASQEKLLEAKASLSLAQTQHALQLQQVKAQMNNMVPRKHFEELQTSLRAEQCKAQQLQESLHRQAEQTCRQLLRTQEEHECLLKAAMEQAEALEHNLRSTEAVLVERAAQLKDAQAQLSRNKLLIEDLREENRGVTMALQTAELKQKSTEEKNQLLEEQASALKQLIGKITPASLSG
ncbi:ninein-like protein isoform X1 [Melopsittacus undulatus]|uniref:ninein-like protein isoform X1 n=1 Tax=Melopsittacus undulatus TaxID=13146 RepID=UPI00146D7B56|nr:ninein-like protein isoform X1 [Melopsittacus undulatus]